MKKAFNDCKVAKYNLPINKRKNKAAAQQEINKLVGFEKEVSIRFCLLNLTACHNCLKSEKEKKPNG